MAFVMPSSKLPQKLKHICCSSSSSSSSATSQCRPAVILPGLGNNSADYQKLPLTLKDYGVPTVVTDVSRFDWLRNAAGLVDPNYWRATLRPHPVLDWYFNRMNDAILKVKEFTPGGTLSLIGHTAGGWLARVYMEEFGFSDISLLLTLGTPHLPHPKGLPGVIDQTRGLLNYVEKRCSKVVYTPELKYVCIAGRYIQGSRFFENSNVDVDSTVTFDTDKSIAEAALVDNCVCLLVSMPDKPSTEWINPYLYPHFKY